jgi:hypothetical protein
MNADWRELVVATGQGKQADIQILKERGNDVRVARVAHPDGNGTVVVKLWNRRGVRGWLRRVSRTNIGWREYAALRFLEPLHVGTPQPLAYLVLRDPHTPYTEALVSADLGECQRALAVFKDLLVAGDDEGVHAFESALIESTAGMLAVGLVDTDHRIPNFVVPVGSEKPVRLDFELCRRVRHVAWHPRAVGLMLGTLLGTHVFAVQPHTEKTIDFAHRLQAAVHPPPHVRRVAQARVAEMLAIQAQERCIEVSVPALWK